MPGPLPVPNHRHRNAPPVPMTVLPPEGRTEPPPRKPPWVKLGKAGSAWWRWAWKTPQAAAWQAGSEMIVARRALLEDVVAAGDPSASLLVEIRQMDDRLGLSPKAMAQLRWTIGEPASDDSESDGNVVVPDRWRNAAAS